MKEEVNLRIEYGQIKPEDIVKKYKKETAQNLRKRSFKNRVTDIWNDLPQKLVQAKTVKSFEILLDKYWENQEVK